MTNNNLKNLLKGIDEDSRKIIDDALAVEDEEEQREAIAEALNGVKYYIKRDLFNQLVKEFDLYVCDYCGKVFTSDDDFTEVSGGEVVCQDCLDNYYSYCENCEEWHPYDDLQEVKIYNRYGESHIEYWCDDCVYNDAYKCCECGEYFYSDNFVYQDNHGNYYCEDCGNGALSYCENCGCYFRYDDEGGEVNGCYYCGDCYEEEKSKGVIKGYHDHKGEFSPKFTKKDLSNKKFNKNYLFGFELEVDDGDDKEECADELNSNFGDSLVFENDGSLNDGFEIISQPMTHDYFNIFDLEKMLNICKEYGFKSHDTDTCGLHLHFNRAFFGNTKQEQTRNISKIMTFYNIFYNDMIKLSRRKENGLRWCEKMINSNNEKTGIINHKNIYNFNSRYNAVNNNNYNTVEFRMGRGTLNADTFRAWVEFHIQLIKNAKKIKWGDIKNVDKWIQDMPKEVMDYIKKRGAFGY